jgi:hypothetical protein
LDILSTPDECYSIYATCRQLMTPSERTRLLRQKSSRCKGRNTRSSRLVTGWAGEEGQTQHYWHAHYQPGEENKKGHLSSVRARQIDVQESFKHKPDRAACKHGKRGMPYTRKADRQRSQAHEYHQEHAQARGDCRKGSQISVCGFSQEILSSNLDHQQRLEPRCL